MAKRCEVCGGLLDISCLCDPNKERKERDRMNKPWMFYREGDTVIIDIPDQGNSLFVVVAVRKPFPDLEPFIDLQMIPPDGAIWTFPEHQMNEEARLVSII